jgi:hypothetical protein
MTKESICLSTLSTDAASQLDVFRHNSNTLGVNDTQVGVLEQTNKVSLGCQHSGGLETQVGLEVLSNLTDQALEGQLPDQEFRALLVFANLAKSHGYRPVTMRLLHSTGGRGGFASCLGGQLLTWGLATSGLKGSLLGMGHG